MHLLTVRLTCVYCACMQLIEDNEDDLMVLFPPHFVCRAMGMQQQLPPSLQQQPLLDLPQQQVVQQQQQ